MYKVELNTGLVISVPKDVRTEYESIQTYGLGAVLERVRRTRAYKNAKATDDAYVRAIITPRGVRVTEF